MYVKKKDFPMSASHPTRGGWIEIALNGIYLLLLLSHPTRGGWIEIRICGNPLFAAWVPPHTGWVD